MLQAYIDDSAEGAECLIMAGYISTPERWSVFSSEWQEILDMRMPYPIKKYHANERRSSDEEREREMYLYRVLERHIIAGLVVCIETAPLLEGCRMYGVGTELANPYLWAIKSCVNLVAQDQRRIGITDPIDFVFDERSEKKYLVEGWKFYKDSMDAEVLEVTGAMPIFRNDEDAKPLQAADMLAYYLLQQYRISGGILDGHWPFPWEGKENHKMFRYQPSPRSLRLNVRQLAEELGTIQR